MHCHYSKGLVRLAIRTVIATGIVSGALNIYGQEAVATVSHVTSSDAYYRKPNEWNSTVWSQSQGQVSLNIASLGFVEFNRVQVANVGTIDLSEFSDDGLMYDVNLIGGSAGIVRPSYDPFKFAATIGGLAPQFENIMHSSPGIPDMLWMGLTPDSDWKHGNDFEAGMTAQFVWGRKARYPVTIRLPMYVAASDEQYFLGPHYGYISAGINLRVPLRFISTRYGRWTAGGNADFCYYGTTTSEFVRSIGLQIPKVAAVFSVEL